MSTLFNEENFLKKLDNLLPTQDSIQSLALWIIHHKTHYEAITKTWLKKLKDVSNSKQILSLFYLANDVIQNCKRKNAKIFQEEFKQHIAEGVNLIKNDESIKPNIERIFNIWKDRNVYEKDYLDKLYELLKYKKPDEANNSKEMEIQKLIADFQPKRLCETITKFNTLEKDIALKKSAIEASKVLELNIDNIKQYRDKSQCTKFYNEFENSFTKLEDYIKYLEVQMNERKTLINLLEQSEIFYDAQYKDAKLVVNAYKGFGTKVHLVGKKIEDVLDKITNQKNGGLTLMINNSDVKLDNLDMEMSDDENDNNNNNNNNSSNSNGFKISSPDTLIKGLPIPTINSSQVNIKSLSPSTIGLRTILDPRQNRLQHSYSSSIMQSPPNLPKIKNDECSTPVKDEVDQNATKNPLDFLTRFINKSSTSSSIITNNINNTKNHTVTNNNNNNNNNNIISSLQKYVCINTNSTFNNNNNIHSPINNNAYDPREYNYEGYYNDDDMMNDHNDTHLIKRQRSLYDKNNTSNNNTSIYINTSVTSEQNRSVTPTKDELYQNADLNTTQQYYQPTTLQSQVSVTPHLQHISQAMPPHASLIGTQNEHMYNYIPSQTIPGYQQTLIPSNAYNPLIQTQIPPPPPPPPPQTTATLISPTVPTPQYIPPYQPTLIQNYQKPISNANKNSNNINININNDLNKKNDFINDDGLKRKHVNDNNNNNNNNNNRNSSNNTFEYPNQQNLNTNNNNNNNNNTQKSYRIPTINSHRNDNISNNNGNVSNTSNNNLNKTYSKFNHHNHHQSLNNNYHQRQNNFHRY